MRRIFCLTVPVLLATAPSMGVLLNQLDDFQNGTTQGWQEGASSPNPPTNVSTGGPAGAGDRYLQNISNASGPGGKMIMFNQVQWTGNFITAGVTRIEADMINLGSSTLRMRVAFSDFSGNRWASDPAAVLAPGGGWTHVTFHLSAAGLVRAEGFGSLENTLAAVSEMRILSSSFPSYHGDDLVATLGVDNLKALPEPASMLLLALGGLLGHRRRR